mmetsp:Transcript_40083/g.159413  ORF Transcript_40083/g.159413 Transcript_40083/m.159413 type:complete len:308 (+) Transcript_40083:100-1023(+)
MAFVGSLIIPRRGSVTNRSGRRIRGRRCPILSLADTSSFAVTGVPQTRSEPSYTYYEGNSWGVQVEGKTVLVDPIVTDLQFGNATIYNQKKRLFSNEDDPREVLPTPDLILISQSLPDHLHLPTMRAFDRTTRIVTTAAAAAILEEEGFSNVKAIKFGERTAELQGEVEVLATAGPILGPPWQLPENGYLTTLKKSGIKIFYEPHSQPQPGALDGLRADVIVAAYDRSVFTPINYLLVAGKEGAIEGAKQLKAKKLFLINNESLSSSGLLKNFVKATGSPKDVETAAKTAGIDLEIVNPKPKEAQSL